MTRRVLLLALTATACADPAAEAPPPASPTPPVAGTAEVLARAMAEQRAVHLEEGALVARVSPELLVRFDADGVRLGDGASLRLAGWGDARPTLGACTDEVGMSGACLHRAELARSGVVEWWRTSPEGLEQGFEVASRPAGDGPLELDLEVEGVDGLDVSAAGATFADAGRTWTVDRLVARDARGRTLPTRFVATTSGFGIVVDDEDATYPLAVDPLYAVASWTGSQGSTTNQQFGLGMTSLGDLNGDGYDDVAVGAPYAGTSEAGAVYVLKGTASGPSTSVWRTLTGVAWVQLGFDLAACDVNHDGYKDLVVGGPRYSSSQGVVYVHSGSSSGIASSPQTTAYGSTGGDQFGYSVDCAGHTNNDVYDDVVVGSPGRDYTGTDSGRAYVFQGSSTGIPTGATRALAAQASGDQLGFSVAGAGDMNNDGYDDVVVGAPYYDCNGYTNTGAAYIFKGASGGANQSYDNRVCDSGDNAHTGWDVAGVGDLNADGYDDVVVSVPDRSSSPYVATWQGQATLTNTTAKTYIDPGNSASDDFGYRIVPLGDVEQDGYPDFAVGAPGASSNAGKVYTYRGSSGTSFSEKRTLVYTGSSGDYAGKGLAGDLDIDGDGWQDLLIGSPGHDSLGQAVALLDQDNDGDGVPRGTDCDDSNGSTKGPSTWYVDADSDGYGVSTTTQSACTQPTGYVGNSTDCDDTRWDRSPGRSEACDPNNLDEDCDGLADDADSSASGKTTWYQDADNDGYGLSTSTKTTCDQPSGHVANSTDCNDTSSAINPGKTEVCDASNTDEDCDSLSDDNDPSVSSTGKTTFYRDADSDTYGWVSTTSVKCDQPSGYVTSKTDCNDTSAAINPGKTEVCDASNTDENCNGVADNNDGQASQATMTTFYWDEDLDGYGTPWVLTRECDLPTGYSTVGTDCDDTNSAIDPGEAEVCDPSDVDEDCDGAADDADSAATGKVTYYTDADLDGYGKSGTGVSRCNRPSSTSTISGDCDDTDALRAPDKTEVCDDGNRDEDCDGAADDDDSSATGKVTRYQDLDDDGYGLTSTARTACDARAIEETTGGDCDDTRPQVYPSAPELCDLLDDDCDGSIDEGAPDADADGTCDARDACPADNPNDRDADGVCDADDLCTGDDALGDVDGDGTCGDQRFTIAAGALAWGNTFTVTVTGAQARSTLYLMATSHPGPGARCYRHGTICPDLRRPNLLAVRTANAAGKATITVHAPDTLADGSEVWFQVASVLPAATTLSDVVSATVQPFAVSISPTHPLGGDDLFATYAGSKVDRFLAWTWAKDGVRQADLVVDGVPGARTAKGETWTATGHAIVKGFPMTATASVVIGNEGPVVGTVTVTRTDTSPCDGLTCAAFAAADPDGDAITWSTRWMINGIEVDDTGEVLSTPVAAGDKVRCALQADDGTATSDWTWSASYTDLDDTLEDADQDGTCDFAEGCVTDTDFVAITRQGIYLWCPVHEAVEGCSDGASLSYAWTVDGQDVGVGTDYLFIANYGLGTEISCRVTGGTLADGHAANTTHDPASTTLRTTSWTLYGETAGDGAGMSVSVLGDLDGDGDTELGIGAPNAAPDGMTSAGRAYVVYGRNDSSSTNLSDVAAGTDGFAWDGETGGWDAYTTICHARQAEYPNLKCSPSSAGRTLNGEFDAPLGDGFGTRIRSGDMDGDGIPEVLVAAPYAVASGQYLAGRVYAFSGATAATTEPVDLAEGGTGGFTVEGAQGVVPSKVITTSGYHMDHDGWLSGWGLGTGDFDGDGLTDLYVGAPNADPSNANSGKAYVVHGDASWTRSGVWLGSVATDDPDATVTMLEGHSPSSSLWSRFGANVGPVGDLDLDGDDELVFDPRRATWGTGYVVLGGTDSSDLSVADLDGDRVRSFGGTTFGAYYSNGSWHYSGRLIDEGSTGVGDVNGDGHADLGVTWLAASDDATTLEPRLAVYWGGTGGNFDAYGPMNGTGGFEVRGTGATHAPPFAAWPLGDLDGDGLDDLAFTAARVTGSGGSVTVPSRIYVVYGRTDTSAINLGQLATGRNGFAITSSDITQYDEVSHGDVDGDGLSDLVYGASELDSGKGRVTVYYGQDTRGKLTQVGGDASDVLTGTPATDHMTGGLDDDRLEGNGGVDVLYGGGGDDTLAVVGTDFRRVDGGIGFDTLEVSGTAALDLADVRGHVRGIEALSLAGSTSVTLSAIDVLRLSDEGNELVVLGGAGDALVGQTDAWTFDGTGAIGGVAARSYRSGNATLLVQDGVDTSFPPVLATTALSVDELSGTGWVVGTVDATDADGTVASVAVDLGEHADALAYDAATHRITVVDGGELDHESDPTWRVTATVTDDDGLTATGTVTITVDDVAEPPWFPVDDGYATVQEGSVDGTLVAVVSADDPDAGDEVALSITSGNEDGAFAIDATTGQITVADGTMLDFETEPTRSLTIRAEDLTGLHDTRTLQVDVGDGESLSAVFTLPFLTEDQSLAKAGRPLYEDETLFSASPELTWGETSEEGDNVIEWPAVGTIDWVVSSSGTLKADVRGTVSPAKMSAYLPVEVSHAFPDQIPLGTAFTVDSSWTLQDDAVLWGKTFGADLTFELSLQDYAISLDFGDLGKVHRGPADHDFEPLFLDIEQEDFGGYKLDVLYPDGLDVPDDYSGNVRAYVSSVRSQTSQLTDAWGDMDPGDASDWFKALKETGEEALTPFESFSAVTIGSGVTQDLIYGLLDLHGVELGLEDGYTNDRILLASTGTQQLLYTYLDVDTVLSQFLPVEWGDDSLTYTFDIGTLGYVKANLNKGISSYVTLEVSESQLFFLVVNEVTADITWENGTRSLDVDVSQPFTLTLPSTEDADGDGKVAFTITYDVDVDVRKLELLLYEIDWGSDVVEVRVQAWKYDYDLDGNPDGRSLYKNVGYGPLIDDWEWKFPWGDVDWSTWQLGGMSRPEASGAIQVTR